MKRLIDENIVVLRQDFNDNTEIGVKSNDKSEEEELLDEAPKMERDGTIIRTYINNVLIKVLVSDAIDTGYKVENKKKEYFEQRFKLNN